MTTTTKNTAATRYVREYVLSVIDFEGTESEKLKFFFDTLQSEYGHEVSRLGMQRAITEYLRGLPSSINHAFMNHEIIDLLTDWGYINFHTTAGQEEWELEQYWVRLAGSLVILGRKYGVIE